MKLDITKAFANQRVY